MPRIQAGAVLKVDLSHTYQNLGSLAPFTILLFMGALIATGLVLVFWTVRIIKPLRSLSQIAHGFADGDWSQRAEVKGDDEVGLLANSFNRMADELGNLYHSLEQTVEERSRQIRTAAEVAQNVTSLSSLDEVLNKTVELLVQQFGFYQASVFLMDQSGKTLEF